MRWRGPLALGALWVAAAGLATSVGLVAVRLVAGEVGGSVAAPLTGAKVDQELAGVSPTPAPPKATRTAQPGATATNGPLRTLHTSGGVVSARCQDRAPHLLYASPADGWRTDRSRDTLVRFVSSRQAVTVRLSCSGSQLLTRSTTDDLTTTSPAPRPSPASPEPSDSPEPDHSDSPSGGSSGVSSSDG